MDFWLCITGVIPVDGVVLVSYVAILCYVSCAVRLVSYVAPFSSNHTGFNSFIITGVVGGVTLHRQGL